MARPLRLEFTGALYHVTSRGDGREDIYPSDADRLAWLETLGQVCARFNWVCHAYCQMTDHYHIVIETPDANLSKGMRQLNGVYTQFFNRTHQRAGHVFQGRFKAILIEKDGYLLELARYVVLNPLRAKMVRRIEQWPWSSYRATCGQVPKPEWLQTDFLLSQFGAQRALAIAKYAAFVYEGKGLPSIWDGLQGQIYLGSESFIKKMRREIEKKPNLIEIPRAQRRALARELADYASAHERDEAIALAFLSGRHTMAAVADYFDVHLTTVSRLVKKYEESL
jgi:putative transposase